MLFGYFLILLIKYFSIHFTFSCFRLSSVWEIKIFTKRNLNGITKDRHITTRNQSDRVQATQRENICAIASVRTRVRARAQEKVWVRKKSAKVKKKKEIQTERLWTQKRSNHRITKERKVWESAPNRLVTHVANNNNNNINTLMMRNHK